MQTLLATQFLMVLNCILHLQLSKQVQFILAGQSVSFLVTDPKKYEMKYDI